MKFCAYCGEAGSLTKEHIWPRSMIQKYEDAVAFYNKRLDRLLPTEGVIKDVCATCNNVRLSKLDAYLSQLYDSCLHQRLSPGEGVDLKYDYDLLLRALLKISYNSARAFAESGVADVHRLYSQYILNGGETSNVQLRLLVVTSARIIADGKLMENKLEVTQLRCAEIPYDGEYHERFIVRLVAINSFWFYLLLSKNVEPAEIWELFIQKFRSWKIQAGEYIEAGSTNISIPVNRTTYMHPLLLSTLLSAIRCQ